MNSWATCGNSCSDDSSLSRLFMETLSFLELQDDEQVEVTRIQNLYAECVPEAAPSAEGD